MSDCAPIAASRSVSIRRRVVDAAEYYVLPLKHPDKVCFNPPPRRGRGGIPEARLPAPRRRVSIRRRVVDAAEWNSRP